MKVGILRRRYAPYAGGERFVQAFLSALVEAGHEVHLFSQAWTAPASGVTVHRVPALAGSTLGLLSYALAAPRLARSAGVALVHSFERTVDQDLYRAGEGCHRQWLDLRRRYLRSSLATLGDLRPFHRVVLAIEGQLSRGKATRFLAVNSTLVEQGFRRHYSPLGAGMGLIRSGVDMGRFNPDVRASLRPGARRALGLTEPQVVLLTVGSGFWRKGVATTIRALGTLRRRTRARPTLLVVGRGRPELFARLARREGVAGQVRFLGGVDDPRPLYAAADIFVLPTVYDPASNATLEALAMGVPVITTATNGSGELLEDRRSGWLLATPGDREGLADALAEALDAARRREVGEAGWAAVAPYTWQRHLEATLGLYGELSS